jgi:hypothetical protein
MNPNLQTETANHIGSSDVLDRPPCTPQNLIKKSKHLLLAFLVCVGSCLLPCRVWSSPSIKSDCLVTIQGAFKPSQKSSLYEMLNLESLTLQFNDLHILPDKNKLVWRLARNAAPQIDHEISEPPPLDGGIMGSSQTITEQHDYQTANSTSPDVRNLVKPRTMNFWSHVVSGTAGALAYIIANWLLNQMGTRWRSNDQKLSHADDDNRKPETRSGKRKAS